MAAGVGAVLAGGGQLFGGAFARDQAKKAASLGEVNRIGLDSLADMLTAGAPASQITGGPSAAEANYGNMVQQAMRARLTQGVGGGLAQRNAMRGGAMDQSQGAMQLFQQRMAEQEAIMQARAQEQLRNAQLQAQIGTAILGAKQGSWAPPEHREAAAAAGAKYGAYRPYGW